MVSVFCSTNISYFHVIDFKDILKVSVPLVGMVLRINSHILVVKVFVINPLIRDRVIVIREEDLNFEDKKED